MDSSYQWCPNFLFFIYYPLIFFFYLTFFDLTEFFFLRDFHQFLDFLFPSLSLHITIINYLGNTDFLVVIFFVAFLKRLPRLGYFFNSLICKKTRRKNNVFWRQVFRVIFIYYEANGPAKFLRGKKMIIIIIIGLHSHLRSSLWAESCAFSTAFFF